MTTTVISTATTAALRPAAGDFVYVAYGGSVLTSTGSAIIRNAATDNNVTLGIDGMVVAAGGSSAVFLDGVAAGVGSNEVSIGAAGVIRSLGAKGLSLAGSGNAVSNSGAIYAASIGVESTGDSLVLRNFGRIEAGGNAISVTSFGGNVRNFGVINSAARGMSLDMDGSVIVNTGEILASSVGVFLTGTNNKLLQTGHVLGATGVDIQGDANRLANTGQIDTNGFEAVKVTGDNNVVFNSGSITAMASNGIDFSGAGATSDQVRINNAGAIFAEINGIEAINTSSLDPNALAHVVNSGTIIGHQIGIFVQGIELDLHNSGHIQSDLFSAVSADALLMLVNTQSGVIEVNLTNRTGAVAGSNNPDNVQNFGAIIGGISLLGGNDLVLNRGTITGTLLLGSGADVYDGTGGSVGAFVEGDIENDTLTGGAGDDTLRGGSEADVVAGSKGDDLLSGGTGSDTLTGGAGLDRFVFANAGEVGTGATADHITDFTTKQDKIDLGFIASGSFIGAAAFSNVAGQVRYTKATGLIEIDQNGDGVTDLSLVLDNQSNLVGADLIL